MVVEIAKQSQHAYSIKYTKNAESMMSITKRGVDDTNNKLEHLELGHCLLPLWSLGRL